MPSSTESSIPKALATFRWRWVLVAIVVGALLVTLVVAVGRGYLPGTTAVPHTDTIVLVGVLAFLLTGIIVGFASPGNTVAEAGVAGLVLAIFSELIIIGTMEDVQVMWLPLGLVGGFFLTLAGAWVGELLQGTLKDREGRRGKLQWPWVLAGVMIGVLLNAYSVILGSAFFSLTPAAALVAFAASFLITGFFVGLFSPGITLAEPALAGVGVIVVDAFITSAGLDAPFPLMAIIIAALGAFVLALVGGWVGELAQLGWHRAHPAK